MVTNIWVLRDGIKDFIGQVFWMRSRKTNAQFRMDVCNHCEKRCKANYILIAFILIFIGIYILSQKGDLPIAGSKQILRLFYDGFRTSAAFAAPRKGNNTKRTHIIASPHNRDKGSNAVRV